MPTRVYGARVPIPTRHRTKQKRQAFGAHVQQELLSGRAGWPVRTGRSRRGFGYSIAGTTVFITNRQRYAVYVEQGTRHIRPRRVVQRAFQAELRALAEREAAEQEQRQAAARRRRRQRIEERHRDAVPRPLLAVRAGSPRRPRVRRVRRVGAILGIAARL